MDTGYVRHSGWHRMNSSIANFDTLYEHSDDPWQLRSRWYERRKRQLTLAALPRERYRNAFEPGCAGGELTVLLATRCDTLLAVDLHRKAVELTRARVAPVPDVLRGHARIHVEQRSIPREWPEGAFDLIVVSELAYYLDDDELHALVERVRLNLTNDGTLVACHWRHPFDTALQSAEAIHRHFDAYCGLARIAHHEETDLLLDVWSRDARSVAQCEGIA
jgi:SAM-dependent methyltransferase